MVGLFVVEKETYSFKIFSFLVGATSAFNAYFIIFGVLFLCGLGLPVPEDITLVSAGYLAGKGTISLLWANVVCFVGVLIGDYILFSIGRRYGYAVLSWPVFKKVFGKKRMDKASDKIRKNARLICFTARFMPGLRACVYLTCGIVGVPFRVFILQDGLAALLSVPLFVWLGYRFHSELGDMFGAMKGTHYIFIVVILAAAYVAFRVISRSKA